MQKTNDNLDDLFDEFYSIKVSEGKAESTLRQYRSNYSYFVAFLDKQNIARSLNAINRRTIRDYIVYMRDEQVRFENHNFKADYQKSVGLTPSSINTRLKTLRVMFNCLNEEMIISKNPMKGVKSLSEPNDELDILTVDEMRRLFKVPDRKYFAGFRDYVIMHVLTDSMMRIGELTQLKVNDFNFDNKTVIVRAKVAKSRKSRLIPLKPLTLRLVKELIKINEEFQSDYVFLTNYGEPITRDLFRKNLDKYAEKAGINKNVHPHLFRHTAATMFLEDGGEIRHLQMLLGHADLRMVIRYTHLSNYALRKEHGKHSPINKVAAKMSRPRKNKL